MDVAPVEPAAVAVVLVVVAVAVAVLATVAAAAAGVAAAVVAAVTMEVMAALSVVVTIAAVLGVTVVAVAAAATAGAAAAATAAPKRQSSCADLRANATTSFPPYAVSTTLSRRVSPMSVDASVTRHWLRLPTLAEPPSPRRRVHGCLCRTFAIRIDNWGCALPQDPCFWHCSMDMDVDIACGDV